MSEIHFLFRRGTKNSCLNRKKNCCSLIFCQQDNEVALKCDLKIFYIYIKKKTAFT